LLIALVVTLVLAACESSSEVMILPTVGEPSGNPILTVLPSTGEAASIQPVNCVPTQPDGEGPYFAEGAPFREQIAPTAADGERLVVTGSVYALISGRCQPLPGAVIDVWQVGLDGQYDLTDQFNYRGKVESADDGSYRFETVMPPPYEGRPAHIHLKINHPDAQPLTTQLYFEGDPVLEGAITEQSPRILRLSSENGIFYGRFDIVLSGS
jgi:protocatechuate 3,4-dioxygenase beta subunit